MNQTSTISWFLFAIVFSNSALGADINLVCTGTEYSPFSKTKSPYSFLATIDPDSATFKIDLERNSDGKTVSYPRDSLWNRTKCPNPTWNLEVTEAKISITTTCDRSDNSAFLWEISRTDGSFILFSFGEEHAKGKCVKSSERAF
jgi:hypothetical protein